MQRSRTREVLQCTETKAQKANTRLRVACQSYRGTTGPAGEPPHFWSGPVPPPPGPLDWTCNRRREHELRTSAHSCGSHGSCAEDVDSHSCMRAPGFIDTEAASSPSAMTEQAGPRKLPVDVVSKRCQNTNSVCQQDRTPVFSPVSPLPPACCHRRNEDLPVVGFSKRSQSTCKTVPQLLPQSLRRVAQGGCQCSSKEIISPSPFLSACCRRRDEVAQQPCGGGVSKKSLKTYKTAPQRFPSVTDGPLHKGSVAAAQGRSTHSANLIPTSVMARTECGCPANLL